MSVEILRLTAFSNDPDGGNPAGVVLDAAGLTDSEMLAIAAEVGFSETAFLVARPKDGSHSFDIRYFSPLGEVDFCGHATIATGIALGQEHGPSTYEFNSKAGPIEVEVFENGNELAVTLIALEAGFVDGVAPDAGPRRIALLVAHLRRADPALLARLADGAPDEADAAALWAAMDTVADSPSVNEMEDEPA